MKLKRNVKLSSQAEIADMIRIAEVCGPHQVPLFQAAAAGRVNLLFPERACRMPSLWLAARQGRPVVTVCGDDDYQPAGPSTWASAAKLRSWASVAIIHGAGGEQTHYAMAVELTKQWRNVLLIETTSAATDEWGMFLSKRADLPLIGIRCRDAVHPAIPAPGALN